MKEQIKDDQNQVVSQANSQETPSLGESQEVQEALRFEQALEKLQGVVKQLEGGELSLDQSLKKFEEGVRLTRYCQKQLATAEQRVELLLQSNSNDGSVQTAPFTKG